MEPSKRFLFLIPTRGFGGAEGHSLTLASHLISNGNSVSFCFPVLAGTSRLFQSCEKLGIEIIDAPIAPTASGSAGDISREQVLAVNEAVELKDFDFIFAASPSPRSVIGLAEAMHLSGCPGCVIFHLVADKLILTPAEKKSLLACIAPWLCYVCVSDFTKDMLAGALGLPRYLDVLHRINNGVSEYDGKQDKLDLRAFICESTAQTIVSVGRLHAQKGCLTLVRAIPIVLERVPNARFVWFGEGPQREEMLELAAKLDASHALILPGFTTEVMQVFASADLVVLPSVYEGLSLTLLESIQAGAAIVTTDASYQDQILSHRVSAGIASVGSAEEIAEEIVYALTEEGVTAAYRKEVAQIASEYTVERMLSKYDELVESIVEVHRADARGQAFENEKPSGRYVLKVDCRLQQLELHRHEKGDCSLLAVLALDHLISEHTSISGLNLALPENQVELYLDLKLSTQDQQEFSCPHRFNFVDVWNEDLALFLLRAVNLKSGSSEIFSLCLFEQLCRVFSTSLSSMVFKRALVIVDALLEVFDQVDDSFCSYGWFFERLLRKTDEVSVHLRVRICSALKKIFWKWVAVGKAREVDDLWGELRPFALTHQEKIDLITSCYLQNGQLMDAECFEAMSLEQSLKSHARGLSSKGQKTAIVFASHFNYPPRSGGDWRIFSVMQAYRRLGMDVVLFTWTTLHQQRQKLHSANLMRHAYGIKTHFFVLSKHENAHFQAAFNKLRQGQIDFPSFLSERLLSEFKILCDLIEPVLVSINYCYFSYLVAGTAGHPCHLVLDTHDIISRRVDLTREVLRLSAGNPMSASSVSPKVFDPNFFAGLRFNIHPDEIASIAIFNTVLIISDVEYSLLEAETNFDSICYLPFVPAYVPAERPSASQRRVLYTGGQNLFNILGAAAIQNHLAPRLCRAESSDVFFRVIGDIGNVMISGTGIEVLGRVPAIEPYYNDASLAICPIPCGTGQNIKVSEALGRGIPVVSFAHTGASAGLQHGVNGMVASDLHDMYMIFSELFENPSALHALRESTLEWTEQNICGTDSFETRFSSQLASTGFKID